MNPSIARDAHAEQAAANALRFAVNRSLSHPGQKVLLFQRDDGGRRPIYHVLLESERARAQIATLARDVLLASFLGGRCLPQA